MKTLNLKYGEYYSLKITDSSKNVINNVEITGNQISSEQAVLSSPNIDSFSENDREILMQGENRLLELKEKKQSGELTQDESEELKVLEEEFSDWTYASIDDGKTFAKDTVLFFQNPNWLIHSEKEVVKHDLKCEIQVLERTYLKERVETPKYARLPVKIFGIPLWYKDVQIGVDVTYRYTGEYSDQYYWADEYTIPRIYNETLTEVDYNIELNQRLLESALKGNNSDDKEFFVLNWRYKLTGGQIKIEKLQKEVVMDEGSVGLRGKSSYTYPESTLIEAQATVDNKALIKHIGDHILDRYKDGRETMEMTWQGDPTMTMGDRIILEDKFGIEREFMITGNEFILENSGKFYMRTEGISVR